MLLTQKTIETVPLEVADEKDLYRAQWKRVQVLAETFWKRWRSEYLASLQKRNKWIHATRNVRAGDVVLLKDPHTPRNNWPMGVVEKASPSADGLTRKVEVKTWRQGKHHVYTRPISEMVVLVEG